MSAREEYDLVAIGGGTAGLVTAAGAAGLGARTALVERHRLGGECLWTGCVPSKALIGSARLAHAMRRAEEFGLPPADPPVEAERVLESVRRVRAAVQPHDDPERFRAMGVDVVEGEARFLSPREIAVNGPRPRSLKARRFVIATGSRPALPPIDGLAETRCYTHETAFDRSSLPRSVVIVGGGPIGIEFAQAYRRLGIRVHLVEMENRILPREDAEIAARLQEALSEEGVTLHTGRRISAVRGLDGSGGLGVEALLEPSDPAGGGAGGERAAGRRESPAAAAGGEALRAEEIFVATGRRPNVEALDLAAAGVEVGPGGVRVDDRLRTSARHIFAAGDVTGGRLFTHVADHEARTVVRNALFPFPARIRYRTVPWCTFTDPEVAGVGLTEEEARERIGGVQAHTYDVAELDRAITDRSARGLVKIVADRRGRILGGHILAPSAGTMIVEVALAMETGTRLGTLSSLVHPYPTMSEAVRRAADAYMRSRLTPGLRRWIGRYLAVARRLPV